VAESYSAIFKNKIKCHVLKIIKYFEYTAKYSEKFNAVFISTGLKNINLKTLKLNNLC
jgi:hypothetical protein